MRKLLISMAAVAILSGCSFPGVHKIDIPQGNIVTQEMIDQLRPGMSRSQVRFIMGTPLLLDTFNRDRWDYLYSYQDGDEPREQERISLFFKDDRLTRFSGDFRPTPPSN